MQLIRCKSETDGIVRMKEERCVCNTGKNHSLDGNDYPKNGYQSITKSAPFPALLHVFAAGRFLYPEILFIRRDVP